MNRDAGALAIFGLACALLSSIVNAPALATPPTPPAQVQLPDADTLGSLRPSAGAFTVPAQVRAHEDVPALTVTVRAIAAGPLGRRALEAGAYDVAPLAKGDTQRIDLRIETRKEDGNYRIEVSLEGEIDARQGVLSKGVFYLVVEQGQARLMAPGDLRRMQVNRKSDAFEDLMGQQPGSADVRLLGERTVPVPAERAASIRPYAGPEMRRAGPSGPPRAIVPYIVDHTETARSLQTPGITPTPSTRLSGQVVFEDFYYNVVGDPNILTPLANATISVWQRFGVSFWLADLETDENGHWEAQVFPAVQTANPIYYYTAHLGNAVLDVRDDAGNEYSWSSADRSGPSGSSIDFGQEMLTPNAEAAQVFATANRGWNHIVTEGGQDPGHVDIQYPDFCLVDTDPDPAVEVWEEISCWSSGVEIVRITSPSNAGPDVILHEYGHALMHRAFGASLPGGSHSFSDVEQDPGLAYSEGWATAFALSVCPDGVFTSDEGPYEDPNEWPICAVNYDAGEYIEGFRHDDLEPDTDLSDDNRMGWLHEGRVAATITDLLDAPNDDNGTVEDRGRNGYEDGNETDRISLATIYRDHMFGFFHSDYADFYAALQGDLSGTTRSLASAINVYNYMAIPVPVICVASKVAMALSPDYAATLDGLRAFRDQVLMPLQVGHSWIQSYYSNSPEMAVLLIGSSEARKSAQVIIEYFAAFGRTLTEPGGFERLARSREPVLPPHVGRAIAEVSRTFTSEGSPELKQKVAEARNFLRTFDGMAVGAAVRRVAAMKPADHGPGTARIRPRDFAPGSQDVDWMLIRQNLPEEERRAWTLQTP